jgi:hypothetical protein
MFKLLISIITLLSTTSTFTMHAIRTSRLQQRAYATMTKKDFDRLVGLQKDNYPLRAHIFASELTVMKKDDEDIENLREHLSLQVNFLQKESDECKENMVWLPVGILSMPIGLALLCDPDIPLLGVPIFAWGMHRTWKSLSGIKKNYSKYKAFWIYKKNLDLINSLLEQKKRLQECLQHEVALEKIKDRYRE